MKISELVKFLNKCKRENGDIEVVFPSEIPADNEKSDTVGICGITTIISGRKKPQYTIICDNNTMDMFN